MMGMNFVLLPDLETDPSPYPGDSIDDVAIWYDPARPEKSVVIATLKASNQKPVLPTGLLTYDLKGNQLQFLPGGTPNNIDLRPGFEVLGSTISLIVASHWYTGEVGLYHIDSGTRNISLIRLFDTGVDKLRGLCMAKQGGQFYYFAVGGTGDVEQYRVVSLDEVVLERHWKLDSEAEGCVADDIGGRVYIAEENTGIWSVPIDPRIDSGKESTPMLFDKIRLFGPLKKGIEGLAILTHETNRYLVASVQDKNRFAIYDLDDKSHIATFHIGATNDIDRVTDTDGIEIFNSPLGDQFPNGLVVVHDDQNQQRELELNQNFKFVSRDQLLDALGDITQ
ncbi:MAG: 3-phytase [Candidatus Azotimanducaceae bacterium]|jgi:3-phytase